MSMCGMSHPDKPEVVCLASSSHDHHYGYDGPAWRDQMVEWPNESWVSPQRTARGKSEVDLSTIASRIPKRPARSVGADVIDIGATHPETSVAMAERVLPKTGTQRRQVYDLALSRGEQGVTDDEAEQILGMLHQSASAARNSLMNDGWLVDTGIRRHTRRGFDAIAWVAVPE